MYIDQGNNKSLWLIIQLKTVEFRAKSTFAAQLQPEFREIMWIRVDMVQKLLYLPAQTLHISACLCRFQCTKDRKAAPQWV